MLDRCENCGVAIEHGREVDLVAEWEAVCRARDGGGREIAVPNRASLQAAIGVEGWAAIGLSPGQPAADPGQPPAASPSTTASGSSGCAGRAGGATQAWMLQTLLNGLTFHPNFAREVRAGRLHRDDGRGALRFYADAIVTVLGAPLVALVSFPLELVGALAKRGGEMIATTTRVG